jgi:ATP-dependent Lon protease
MDKVGADWRGDPSSALLEVLDPEQNHTFRDHYLEFDLDLSDVMFIATANIIESIPAPLLDRTEVIRLDGYTDREKVTIAREHLLPRQVARAGLEDDEVVADDDVLAAIVDGYTREAGVRGLERQLGKLTRKIATKVATDPDQAPFTVPVDGLTDLLGKPPIHRDEAADRTELPGVATGLAVTGAGGDVLFVEATAMDGEPGLTLTGQLGDVMKESAQIALSYVRANAPALGIDAKLLDRRFHIHVPAGAIPKDGPSAGVTIATALVSLLSGRKVDETLGMTGEVTLQGRVLPIGGVKQKVLAAHRAGLTQVVLPARNEVDLDDIPDQVREEMTFHVLDNLGDVLSVALGPAA